jgi:hypothetical protein
VRRALPFVLLLFLASPALAAPPPDATPQQVDEAKRRYSEGHAKFLAGRYDEALAILVQSNALVPSPNSGLLIARCLYELHRNVEAYEKFVEVENAALDLVRSGETRYGETAAAAAKEKTAARAKIGALKLSARPNVTATVDGKVVTLSPQGEASAFHDPGATKIVFKQDRYEDVHAVTAEAGKEIVVTFRPPVEAASPPPSPPPPPPPAPPVERERESRGVPWYGLATGGIALVGVGAFVGFGLSSESTFSDLESRCAPRCTEADRVDADGGRRMQVYANIGLVVGIVAGLITTIIVLSR